MLVSPTRGTGRGQISAAMDERYRKDSGDFDIESVIPNEILATILAFVCPADVPTVARVARRWRDLAPPPEPDVVLAYKDRWGMNLAFAPRSAIEQRYLDRLRLEASGTFVDNDDEPDDDIREVCLFLGQTQSITLWQLFRNVRGHNVEMFAVWVHELCDVIDDYWVTRSDNKRDLAGELVDWACSELAATTDDDGDGNGPDATSFEMPDLESDENLREMSALVDEACKIVR
ncbi:F-box incomplete domain containing protein [Pandoravirus salinus]|uniref:F-box incomplete domain containing protein n=1 Tax=Pandoravirus salinus TaxID=1349410 RepID=S4VVP5_9VIRU|nr:F-box incomplete domain [Pandoravirus salinus]AGO84719.2 F-box incomplete domain containing protein [Pandoravirus salinus]